MDSGDEKKSEDEETRKERRSARTNTATTRALSPKKGVKAMT